MKQLEVQIMGQSYLLGCPEGGEQRLLEAVERVDSAMCRIRDAGKVKARERIAVLAALNLAFDLADRTVQVLPVRPAAPGTAAPPAAAPDAAAADAGAQGAGPDESAGAQLAPDPRLAALLARLDRTLGNDGHLL